MRNHKGVKENEYLERNGITLVTMRNHKGVKVHWILRLTKNTLVTMRNHKGVKVTENPLPTFPHLGYHEESQGCQGSSL